jgi:uncharacterized repeat protein (TIGR01451 family)
LILGISVIDRASAQSRLRSEHETGGGSILNQRHWLRLVFSLTLLVQCVGLFTLGAEPGSDSTEARPSPGGPSSNSSPVAVRGAGQAHGFTVHKKQPPNPPPPELTFTFDSPGNSWSADELTTLRQEVNDFYPVARVLYGVPASALSVNIRKVLTTAYSGEYNPVLNEIGLLDAAHPDVLCHEMLHAFRDDLMVRLSSFEEGMVRAVEIEVFNRLPSYSYPLGKNHSYSYDVYYEGLDKPNIGSQNGDFFSGYVSALLRYELAGYAWGKALLENTNFFVDFNRELFAQASVDPSILSTESNLVALAGAVQGNVEGKSFARWYAQQGVLNTDPPRGYWLYDRLNQFTIDYFVRSDHGQEIMLPDATITHSIYDCQDQLLDRGSDQTSAYGLIMYTPNLPVSYAGRVRIVCAATTPENEVVTDNAFAYAGSETGVFGIIIGPQSGLVRLTPLDAALPPVQVNVFNGAFTAESLTTVKGRLIATFTDAAGRSCSRQFTKDASEYFLPLTTDGNMADLAVTQTVTRSKQKAGSIITYRLTLANTGPASASDIVVVDRLPGAGSLLSVSTSAGTYSIASVPVNGLLTVNLETLTSGGSATVTVAVGLTSALPDSVTNQASIYAASIDPNSLNNVSQLVLGFK